MLVERICLRHLINLRQINFATIRYYRSFLKNETQAYIFRKFYDNCLLGSMLKTQMLSQVQCFKIYHYLRNDAGDMPTDETKKDKKTRNKLEKNDVKIIITYENGRKSSMHLSEAQKYAKHNNLSLVKLDDLNYRFEKGKFKFLEKKTQKNNLKKFIVRDSIAEHDLQIKINYMLKYIEKQGVLLVLENVHDKLNDVNNKIKNSILKEFVIGETKSSKRIILTLKKKEVTEQQNTESSQKIEFIKTTKNNESVTDQNTQIKDAQ